MSNWVHVLGCIEISGITYDGLKKMYNLKNKKEFNNFFENSNNWKHKFDKKRNYLQIDHRKYVEKLIKNLPNATGSEGDVEVEVCFYNKHYKIWGRDSSSSESRDYNINTGELIPFGYSIDADNKTYEEKGWRDIMFEGRGDRFTICVFGHLRDRDLLIFKKEFNKFLSLIEKYFILNDINVEASEDWTDAIGKWSYDFNLEKDTSIKYEEKEICNE